MSKKNIDASSKLEFYKGDIRDKLFLNNIFAESLRQGAGIDGVIHFAGLKSVKDSCLDPINYWNVNVTGSINLIEVMNKYNCRKLIFSSTASIYGNSKEIPFKESCLPKPLNPYTNTKLVVETFLNDLHKNYDDNWNIICLRYFNPIGAHHTGILGEEPKGMPNNIFPLILRSIAQKSKFYIFGKDWPTPDGTCIRDYIHIEDLAQGHIAALEKLFYEKVDFMQLNLGTGKGTSVLELINEFEKVNKVRVDYEFTYPRPGDCPILIANNDSAQENIKWIPRRNIEIMCKDGFKWLKKNPQLFNFYA